MSIQSLGIQEIFRLDSLQLMSIQFLGIQEIFRLDSLQLMSIVYTVPWNSRNILKNIPINTFPSSRFFKIKNINLFLKIYESHVS